MLKRQCIEIWFPLTDLKESNNYTPFEENIVLYVKYTIFYEIYPIKQFWKWFQKTIKERKSYRKMNN